MSKDKSIWESIGYRDIDGDGDVDFYDVGNEDDDFNEIKDMLYPDPSDYDDSDDIDDNFDDDDDDDEDDDEEDDDEEDDEEDDDVFCDNAEPTLDGYDGGELNTSITLSFSIEEPPRTKPTTGMWKYYDESWGSWNFAKALMDKYPELKKNYDYEYASDTFALDILVETFEIDPKRALSYFEWIIDFFPAGEVQQTRKGEEYFSYCTITFFDRLLDSEDSDRDYIYLYFLEKPKILSYLLISVRWDRHNRYPLENLMKLFEDNKNYAGSKAIYQAYLEHQQDRYTDRDLGKFWESRFIFIDDVIDAEFYELIESALSKLGEYGKKSRKLFAKIRKEQRGDIAVVEDEIAEIDTEIEELQHKKEQLLKKLSKRKHQN